MPVERAFWDHAVGERGDTRLATLRASPVATGRAGPFETARPLVRWRRLMVAISLLSIVVVGLIAKFPEAILPVGSDTGMFATYARMTLHGARPYVDFYDIHPPVTLYYWVLVESLVGSDWARTCVGSWGTLVPQPCVSLLAHVLDLALTFVAAGLAYLIARRLGLRSMVGVLAALLVVWFANESMISMEGSTPTKLTLVPSTLAVYAYLRALPNGRVGWGLLSGAAAALAVLVKQPALTTVCTLVVAVLVGVLRGERAQRRLLLVFVAGGVIMLAPVLAYLAWIGSLGGFLDQAWRYNLERLVVGYWQTPAGLTAPATRIDRVVGQSAGLLFIGALLGGTSGRARSVSRSAAATAAVGPVQPGRDRRVPRIRPGGAAPGIAGGARDRPPVGRRRARRPGSRPTPGWPRRPGPALRHDLRADLEFSVDRAAPSRLRAWARRKARRP